MKLVRYGPAGQERPGVLDDLGRVRDASAWVADWCGAALDAASLARWSSQSVLDLPVVPGVSQVDFRLGPCVGVVGKCIGIGLNYADHAAEAGMQVPPEPVMFLKATSCICGPNDAILIPPGSQQTDWEVELAVVIGTAGRCIHLDQAEQHIAGYCIMNDVSERHYQFNRSGTWDKGKGFDTFGPLGPWLVTRDELADPTGLNLWLEVDGKRHQNGNTQTMVYEVPYLVHYVSQFMSLQPGDVITTGTPPGVGMGQKPPVFLRPGQVLRLGIDGLGEQRCETVAA